MGERMRIALFSRVLAAHVPVGDVLPAEAEEVASADVLEGRAHDCCRVCEHRSWENDRAGCGMLDCMSLLLVDVRRRRTCDVPGPADGLGRAETTECCCNFSPFSRGDGVAEAPFVRRRRVHLAC